MRRPIALLALPLALALASCAEREPQSAQAPAEPAARSEVVLTTFYPMKYFSQQISGGAVPVELPLPEGEDPIFWQPDADTIERYQSATLVVVNGAEFEKWTASAPLPRARTVDTAEGFQDEFVHFEHAVTHSHGPAGEHSHEGVDGHTWLDPNLAIQQARAIERAMAQAFPEHADAFAINLMTLESNLRDLNQQLSQLTDDVAGVRMLASHPAYNYIAQRYAWTITNLDLDPEAPMNEEDVGEVLRAAGDDTTLPIVLLWESEPASASAALLESAGVTNVLFSPAENPSPDELQERGDYIQVMRANIQRLRDALDG